MEPRASVFSWARRRLPRWVAVFSALRTGSCLETTQGVGDGATDRSEAAGLTCRTADAHWSSLVAYCWAVRLAPSVASTASGRTCPIAASFAQCAHIL